MTGLQLIKKAFLREPVERIPWVPFVGVHAANLIDVDAEAYLKSTDHIINGISEAVKRYNPDGVPVAFDLQIEAEALGCKLQWSKDNPPAVISHPLQEGLKVEDLKVPCSCKGRIPLVLDAAAQLREKFPDLALYGLITGPFTLALHLMGTDIFMKFFESPDEVHQLMKFSTEVSKMMAGKYIESGCDVIAMVDPMTSQIDPDSFNEFVLPYASAVFDEIRDQKALSSFFVCGNAQQNIEVMCKCNPDNISIDENIPLDYVRDIALDNSVSFGGNMRLTVVLLMGSAEDSQREALACMDAGGKQGFILAPGCDLPMDTPEENIKSVTEIVHNELLQGSLRASEAEDSSLEKLDLKDHWQKDKVVIDVVTLDSSSCAPCQYMFNAVERAAESFGDKVIFKEYRIKNEEGVQMMTSLGVQHIPTVVIDGEVEFSSRIPPVGEIKKKIEQYIEQKNI
ncbi:MAG TPA: uroporphyrinogen decarboxylase family protein [Bacteroidales bacterium]|nr:uroporphyrinogen decarboxylase family protein [Bacteroidales bacterium]